MHEGKETEQTIVVGIEIAIVEGFVVRIPKGVHERFSFLVLTHHRGSCQRAHKANAVA